MVNNRVLEILGNLVRFDSVSCHSNRPINESIRRILEALPMQIEWLSDEDQQAEKTNLVATVGPGTGGLLYCAHTDVVPVDNWDFAGGGPFQLTEQEGKYFGRGSCDMKGSLACFLAALEQTPFERLRAPLSLIVTADEEIGYLGAKYVREHSRFFAELLQQQPVTIIGEPTRLRVIHAHKGVYCLEITSKGLAGHSSTNDGMNANLKMIPFLQEMLAIHEETSRDVYWQDDRFDPPTINWNIGINDYTYASNIVPERSVCTICFRPMPAQDPQRLLSRVELLAHRLGLHYELAHSGEPVFVNPDSQHIQDLLTLTGQQKSLTVSYGTDAAMLTGLEKIAICGPGDIAQAHTSDEWISGEQLEKGTELYRRMIERFCL